MFLTLGYVYLTRFMIINSELTKNIYSLHFLQLQEIDKMINGSPEYDHADEKDKFVATKIAMTVNMVSTRLSDVHAKDYLKDQNETSDDSDSSSQASIENFEQDDNDEASIDMKSKILNNLKKQIKTFKYIQKKKSSESQSKTIT